MAQEKRDWSLPSLVLPRDEMIEAINGAQSVPPAAKAMLVEMVERQPLENRFLKLNAHCNCYKNLDTLHISLGAVR